MLFIFTGRYINETEKDVSERDEVKSEVGPTKDNNIQEVINKGVINWRSQHSSHLCHENEVV